MNSPKLYLVHASTQNPQLPSEGNWIYLGRNYLKQKAWANLINKKLTRIDFSEELQQFALSNKKSYNNLVREIGQGAHPLIWWTTRTSERNTYLESMYHKICYFDVSRARIDKLDTNLFIVAESTELINVLSDYAEKKGMSLNCQGLTEQKNSKSPENDPWESHFNDLQVKLKEVRKTKEKWKIQIQNTLSSLASPKPKAIIHNWIDDSYFSGDNGFNERYLPKVNEYLQLNGYETFHIPIPHNTQKSFAQICELLLSSKDNYLIPELLYDDTDYKWAAEIIRSQKNLHANRSFEWKNIDVTNIVKHHLERDSNSTELTKFILYYRLFEKLDINRFEIFIDAYENMVVDKPLALSISKHYPETKTIGYQHYLSTIPSFPCFGLLDESQPCYSKIICNSKLTRSQLIEEGYRSEQIAVGPSLRYQHILDEPLTINQRSNNRILIILPIEEHASTELLDNIINALDGGIDAEISVKPHPGMPEPTIQKLLDGIPKTLNFNLLRDPLPTVLGDTCLALALAGTSLMEIALSGVPLIAVGRTSDFNLNPLEHFKTFERPITCHKKLKKRILEKLSTPNTEEIRWARATRPIALSPVNESMMGEFIPR